MLDVEAQPLLPSFCGAAGKAAVSPPSVLLLTDKGLSLPLEGLLSVTTPQ